MVEGIYVKTLPVILVYKLLYYFLHIFVMDKQLWVFEVIMYILCLCNHFLFVCDSFLIILVCFFMHLNPWLYVLLFFDIVVVKVIKHKPSNKHKHTNIYWHTYSTKHRIVILWLSAFLFIFHFVFFDNHIQKWKTSTITHVVIIISNVSCFRAVCNKKSRRTRYSKIAKND